jgi:hypothetical protein
VNVASIEKRQQCLGISGGSNLLPTIQGNQTAGIDFLAPAGGEPERRAFENLEPHGTIGHRLGQVPIDARRYGDNQHAKYGECRD